MAIIHDFFFSMEKVDQREGFSDEMMVEVSSKIPGFTDLIIELSKKGFKYAGDTKSSSKAFTDCEQKKIYIGKDKSVDEACLSLFYEMTNAKNHARFKDIHDRYLSDRDDSDEQATNYAREILKIEAEAVFQRCKIAQILNLTHLLKNPKYFQIFEAYKENAKQAESLIFEEMLANGKVHNGKKAALDHYKECFFQAQQKLRKRDRII